MKKTDFYKISIIQSNKYRSLIQNKWIFGWYIYDNLLQNIAATPSSQYYQYQVFSCLIVRQVCYYYLYTVIIQMGQANQSQSLPCGEYATIREVANGTIVRQGSNGRLHFVKEYSFTNQQAYQQAFVNFSKKLPEKHEHILYLERTNTKLENTFCSTFYKISLLYEYLDHTLEKEIRQRIQQKKVFDEKEVWSVLCSCALAVSEMIRFEGRSHSALRTKDLRLTHEGVVKILSLEMVGMDPDHDINQEGTVKQLALTILNCILMDEITNDSEDFLLELIDALDSSPQMKNILRIMLNHSTRFIDLEEYLFKLVQEDTQSLNSYTHTPIIKEKNAKNSNSYSRIPEESKEDDSLVSLAKDFEDNPENINYEPCTMEQEVPDENDLIEDSKSKAYESHRGTLRDKNSTPSSEKNELECSKKQQFTYTNNSNENSLFTDPKLLSLINTNLEQINKRKSVANSRKLGYSESSSKLERSDSKQIYGNSYNNAANTLSSINLGIKEQANNINQAPNSKSNHTSLTNLTNLAPSSSTASANIKQSNVSVNSNTKNSYLKQIENSRVSNRQEKSTLVLQQQVKSVTNISSNRNQENSFKNEKTITSNKSNPEDKKLTLAQKKYDNIMQIQQMGFKKQKPAKSKEQIKQAKEQIRATFNPSSSNVNTVVYNSNSSSSYNSNTLPLSTNYGDKQSISENSRGTIQFSCNQPRQQFEYVSETYLKGKYEGTKLNNMRHGKGVFYYNEGGKYIGEWKQNKMDGKGVLYYPNNSIAYDGEWKEDQLEGRGTLYNEQVVQLNIPFDFKNWEDVDEYWIKYQGQFQEDSKNGIGKLFLSNGEIFQGNFKDDMVWGQGYLIRKDGSRVKGLWRENKLIKLF